MQMQYNSFRFIAVQHQLNYFKCGIVDGLGSSRKHPPVKIRFKMILRKMFQKKENYVVVALKMTKDCMAAIPPSLFSFVTFSTHLEKTWSCLLQSPPSSRHWCQQLLNFTKISITNSFLFREKKCRIRFPKPVFHSLSLAWIPIKTEFSPPPYKPPFIAVNNPSSRCLTDSSAKACNSCIAKKMISPLHWIFLRNK